jgi:glycosyltransferase involved in cell wall biosynthesis
MSQPLVTVICLCYNQAQWVEEAVASVLNQTYQNIQVIVADDASTDDSPVVIRNIKIIHPGIEILLLTVNEGNCGAFNKSLKLAKGDYIIDFATDDVFNPDRIEKQVAYFDKLDNSFGVVFTDAEYIDAKGEFIRSHFAYLFKKRLLDKVPQGNVYREVLSTYFIPSPTMMVKRQVLEEMNGYDETLTYEDFDFWVRSSRKWKYAFLDECLTKIRKTGKSMSSGWYKQGDKQLLSTYAVCRKAMLLNRDKEDVASLLVRLRYELRQSIFSGNNNEAKLFYGLLVELEAVNNFDRALSFINTLKLPLGWLRNIYHSIRFR